MKARIELLEILALKRHGYRVLIPKKDMIFYKIDEGEKIITVYVVIDQRRDY